MVLLLACIAVYAISQCHNSHVSDYISGVGSVASVYAILIAIWESRQAKTAAQAAESAATKKSKEIERFMSFANINRHIEIANGISPLLAAKQYEAVIIKIDQIKELLTELKVNNNLNNDDQKSALNYVFKLGSDITSLRKQLIGYDNLEDEVVISHITNVNTFLQEIEAKLKQNEL